MKHSALFPVAALVLAASLAACSKKDQPVDSAPAAQPASAASAASSAAAEKPRLATFDPNLKPAEIVWDSPEKKKAWEARQAQLRANQANPAAKPASTPR